MRYVPYLTLAIRVFVGGFFLYAAIPKIAEPLAFATSISHYEMMPLWTVNAFALVVPWLEVLVGVALVVGFKLRTNALLAGALLLMFTVAVAWAISQGLELDCGCFGAEGGEEVSWLKVGKNLLMVAGCAIIYLYPKSWLSLDEKLEESRIAA